MPNGQDWAPSPGGKYKAPKATPEQPHKGGIYEWPTPPATPGTQAPAPKFGMGTKAGIWKHRTPKPTTTAIGSVAAHPGPINSIGLSEYSAGGVYGVPTNLFYAKSPNELFHKAGYQAQWAARTINEIKTHFSGVSTEDAAMIAALESDIVKLNRYRTAMQQHMREETVYRSGVDPSEEPARVQARDARLAAHRASSRGETALYRYLPKESFRRAIQGGFS